MNASHAAWFLLAILLVGPTLACLVSSLTPLVMVGAAAAVAVRLVWFYTRR
jgi:hypothetical protein